MTWNDLHWVNKFNKLLKECETYKEVCIKFSEFGAKEENRLNEAYKARLENEHRIKKQI